MTILLTKMQQMMKTIACIFDNFSQRDITSEDGSANGEENYEYGDGEMNDSFWQAQDMVFEEESVENENLNTSDGDYSPRLELDVHDELEEEEDSASDEQSSNLENTYFEDIIDICK